VVYGRVQLSTVNVTTKVNEQNEPRDKKRPKTLAKEERQRSELPPAQDYNAPMEKLLIMLYGDPDYLKKRGGLGN
jgi:hypothetical protein